MSKINICLSEVRNANYRIPSLVSKLDNVKSAIGLMRYRIPKDVIEKYDIKQRMNNVYQELNSLEQKLDEIYDVTNSCVDQYLYTEQVNNKNAKLFD